MVIGYRLLVIDIIVLKSRLGYITIINGYWL